MLVWSLGVALVVPLVARPGFGSAVARLAVLLLVIGLGVRAKPEHCSVQASLRALKEVPAGLAPAEIPSGYPEVSLDRAYQPYEWEDYRGVLGYLRAETRPDEPVANLLRIVPALTGPSGRLPALPAESLAWLLVKPDDEPEFLQAVAESKNAVVVWAPSEAKEAKPYRLVDVLHHLDPIVRRNYHPVARFGAIEVWRRGKAAEVVRQTATARARMGSQANRGRPAVQ